VALIVRLSNQMKAIATSLLFSASISAWANDGISLKDALHLTEGVTSLNIVDPPRNALKGSPLDLFAKHKIERIIAIGDIESPRSILTPIAQSWIDLVRWSKPLTPINANSPTVIIGFIVMSSGDLVVVRRSEAQIVIQTNTSGGAIPAQEFPDILGITARISKAQAEQPGANQPATKPADKAPAEVQPPTPTSKDGPR